MVKLIKINISSKKTICSLLITPITATAVLLTNVNHLASSLPPLIPRQVFFSNPSRRAPQISPNGKYLTYLAPDQQKVMQIWMRTIGKQDDRMLTTIRERGIQDYSWTYNSRQLLFKQDSNGDENWQFYTFNTQTNQARNLTPHDGVQARLLALDPNFPNEALVAMNLKDRRQHDSYRINLSTGKAKLEAESPANLLDLAADRRFQVRAAVTATPDGGSKLLVRKATNNSWKTLQQWDPSDKGKIVGFSGDGKSLYSTNNHDANTIRLTAFDTTTGKETILAQDPQYDVSNLLIHPVKDTIQAVGFQKEKLEWKVLDKSIAADFATLAKIRRGQFEVIDRDLDDRIWLVAYTTDDGPVYYYTYERNSKKANFLFSNQPKLEGLPLAQMKPISYKSRDGLTIHGYLTTPVGIPAKNLPTVLLVHGGPWSRDTWEYNPMVQFLANRGYAVLQVNFRGSTGYGKAFLNAGNREWGAKMHDDLIDGVKWAIDQGVADSKRIAIMGTSYGGYAALVGLTFTPNVFAAGVSVVGPSNLLTLYNGFPPYWEAGKAEFRHRVGNPDTEADFLRSRSPLFFVDRIQAPLLLAQAANDVRVKRTESEQIVNAMRKENKPVEYILYQGEGHKFARPANRLHLTAKIEEFLGKQLGGRVEPLGSLPKHSAVIK